jgi:hypothetical protein
MSNADPPTREEQVLRALYELCSAEWHPLPTRDTRWASSPPRLASRLQRDSTRRQGASVIPKRGKSHD